MGRIRRRAAAVLRFIDTVTQAPVPGSSLYIQTIPQSPVLWKEDGYAVIMEQPGVDSLDISVSGGFYAPARFHIDICRDAPVRICYIHLLPAPAYPFTEKMAVIRGECMAEGLWALRMADAGRYRLVEDLTGGTHRIRLWGNGSFSLGQLLVLNEAQRYEPVILHAADEETTYGYHIRKPLKGDWKKANTKIYSAIRIVPDDKGEFCIAYDRIRKDGEMIRFLSGDCRQPEKGTEVAIQEGQETTFHVGMVGSGM